MAKSGESEKRMLVCPGKIFRNEAVDMTHEAQFYQFDGFAVGPTGTVTLAHLKGTFTRFIANISGRILKYVFVRVFSIHGAFGRDRCMVWKRLEKKDNGSRWLGGDAASNVLKNAGLDPEKSKVSLLVWHSRHMMVKYGIRIVRLFTPGDIRYNYAFLKINSYESR